LMNMNRGLGQGRDRALEVQLSSLRKRVAEIDRLIQGIVESDASCAANELIQPPGVPERRNSQSSFSHRQCERAHRIRI
jgi:hypothetical protein